MATAQAKSISGQSLRSSAEMVTDSLAMGVIFALGLTIVGRVIGFLRGIMFCRLMTDQQLGQWSMVCSFLTLLAPLAVLGLPGCFGRFVEHYRQRDQLGPFVKRIAWISAFTTLAFSLSMLLFPAFFSWLAFRDPSQIVVVRLMGLSLIVLSAMNFLISLMESLRQVRIVTIMRFAFGVVFAFVGCGLLLFWEDGTSAATVSYAIGCVVASLPAIWFVWKYRTGFLEGGGLQARAMWSRIAPFAIWLWWSNLFHNLFEVSDRYMLIHWSPESAEMAQRFVGQYHSGRVVPLLLVNVASMLAGILMPYLTAAWEEGNKSKVVSQVRWTIKLVAITFTAGGLGVVIGAPILFDWILQGRYDDGLAVLPLTLTYCIWFSTVTIAQDYLWVREKGKQAFIVVGLALAANILLNILLIPSWGLWGAVIATSIANAICLILILSMNHRAGCQNDAGIWICCALPLLFLVPPLAAIAVLAIVAFVGVRTTWVFSQEEKDQVLPLLATAVEKTRDRFLSKRR